jgi:hypothetical protein
MHVFLSPFPIVTGTHTNLWLMCIITVTEKLLLVKYDSDDTQ